MRYILLFIFCLIAAPASYASALGDAECALEISIDHQEKGLLMGTIEKGRGLSYHSNYYCWGFDGTKVRLTGKSGYPAMMLEVVQSVTLGVQRFSSMGENGAVQGEHWEILEMIEANEIVPPNVLPIVKIEILSD